MPFKIFQQMPLRSYAFARPRKIPLYGAGPDSSFIRNLTMLALIGLGLVFGCTSNNSKATDDDAPKTIRGRFMFTKSLHALRVGDSYVYRDVTQYFFFDGKPWAPADDPGLADRVGGCDTSPNSAIEMLRCSGDFAEGYRTTYILRVNDGRPEAKKIDETCGTGPVWIDNDGQWMLFPKCYYNVVTDEKIPVKGMPFADDPQGSTPVQYVLGVSPDKKTVIGSYDLYPDSSDKDKLVKLWVIDPVSGKAEIRKASLARFPWLTDYEQPTSDILPPAAASKHFVWKRGVDGRDTLVEPELLGVWVRKQFASNK